MHKLVIIDDEVLIAEGLARSVPWEEVGCKVVGTATDGEEGWALIERLEPDIVISDIVMPRMDGLKLARRLAESYPETRLILISAYRDFSFAQQAIRFSAVDYVLKPIEPKRLLDAAASAATAIESERDESRRIRHMERTMAAAKPIVSASLLFQIARSGPSHLSEIDQHLISSLPEPNGVIIRTRLFPMPDGLSEDLHIEAQRCFVNYCLQEELPLIRGNSETGMVFISLAGADDLTFAEIKQIVDQACRHVGREMNLICAAVVSQPFHDYVGLQRQYQQTEHLLEPSLLTDSSGLIEAEAQEVYLGQDAASRLMVAIDQNDMRQDYSLKEMAGALHMSTSALSRLFKQKTGHNFIEVLTRRRVAEAERLLTDTGHSIREIADQSGFGDARYFSQVFKRRTGLTPSEFRAQLQP